MGPLAAVGLLWRGKWLLSGLGLAADYNLNDARIGKWLWGETQEKGGELVDTAVSTTANIVEKEARERLGLSGIGSFMKDNPWATAGAIGATGIVGYGLYNWITSTIKNNILNFLIAGAVCAGAYYMANKYGLIKSFTDAHDDDKQTIELKQKTDLKINPYTPENAALQGRGSHMKSAGEPKIKPDRLELENE